MKRKYICEICGKPFESEYKCSEHEANCEQISKIMVHLAKNDLFDVQETQVIREILVWLYDADMMGSWTVDRALNALDAKLAPAAEEEPNPIPMPPPVPAQASPAPF